MSGTGPPTCPVVDELSAQQTLFTGPFRARFSIPMATVRFVVGRVRRATGYLFSDQLGLCPATGSSHRSSAQSKDVVAGKAGDVITARVPDPRFLPGARGLAPRHWAVEG